MKLSKLFSTLLLSSLSVFTLNNCENRTVARVTPSNTRVERNVVPVDRRDVDLLFVIDTSGSMAEEQQSLLNNFPVFIEELENIQGGLPNMHIGIISPDVGDGGANIDPARCTPEGDRGALQAQPSSSSCTGVNNPNVERFIVDEDDPNNPGQRRTNYKGTDPSNTLSETFSCIADIGTNGCGFEQPLEAIRKAIVEPNASNAGFIRPGAFLGIIVITDEDDCSLISSQSSNFFDQNGANLSSELGPLNSFRCFEQGVVCDGDPSDPADRRNFGFRENCTTRSDSTFMPAVQDYIDDLKGLKSNPLDVFVATIAGPTERVEVGPLCPSTRQQDAPEPGFVDLQNACSDERIIDSCPINADVPSRAHPAVRLAEFSSTEAFPTRSSTQSICNEDLRAPLQAIAEILASAVGSPCLVNTPIDLDPDPNVERFDCNVFDVAAPRTPSQTETRIDSCAATGGTLPCWQISADDECGADLRLDVCRGAGTMEEMDAGCPAGTEVPVEDGTEVQTECFVEI